MMPGSWDVAGDRPRTGVLGLGGDRRKDNPIPTHAYSPIHLLFGKCVCVEADCEPPLSHPILFCALSGCFVTVYFLGCVLSTSNVDPTAPFSI